MHERFRPLTAAALMVGAEVFIATSAIAQNDEIKPVDPSLMREAIECVLTVKPGKTVLYTKDYPQFNLRKTEIKNKGKRYFIDTSKSYTEETVLSDIEIVEISKGKSGNEQVRIYYDGTIEQLEGAAKSDDISQRKEAILKLTKIEAQKKLDGHVDYGRYPEDEAIENRVNDRFINGSIDPLAAGLYLEARFQVKRDIYQKGYNSAIQDIVEACRENK